MEGEVARENVYEIAIIGDKGVGKTGIALRFRHNVFTPSFPDENNYYQKVIKFDKKSPTVLLNITKLTYDETKSYQLSQFQKECKILLFVFQ